MALPTTIAPSGVNMTTLQPSSKSFSVSGKSQAVSAEIHRWKVTFDYALLTFTQRDEFEAFLDSQNGRVGEFYISVPTYTENSNLSVSTVAIDGTYAAGATSIGVTGLGLESFALNNIVQVVGKTKLYRVTAFTAVSGGAQTITIHPPLKSGVTAADSFKSKDCEMLVSLESDELMVKSKGMEAEISVTMIEEI